MKKITYFKNTDDELENRKKEIDRLLKDPEFFVKVLGAAIATSVIMEVLTKKNKIKKVK